LLRHLSYTFILSAINDKRTNKDPPLCQ